MLQVLQGLFYRGFYRGKAAADLWQLLQVLQTKLGALRVESLWPWILEKWSTSAQDTKENRPIQSVCLGGFRGTFLRVRGTGDHKGVETQERAKRLCR